MAHLMKTKIIAPRQSMLFMAALLTSLLFHQGISFFLGGLITIIASSVPFFAQFHPLSLKRSVFSFVAYTLLKYTLFAGMLLYTNSLYPLSWPALLTGVISAQACYILACYMESQSPWQ